MSSSTTQTPAPPRTPAPALLHVLRSANQRYAKLAAAVRSAQRPTHHARKRAQALELRVCIAAARGLDPRQISVVPLPVLASPVQAPCTRAAVAEAEAEKVVSPLPIVAPLPVRGALQAPVQGDVPQRPARPVLRCSILSPQSAATEAPETALDDDAQLRSYWSSSEDEGDSEDDDNDDNDDSNDDGPYYIDAARLSWVSTASLSAGSTSGPATPDTDAPLPLTIRIKRKSSASSIDAAVACEKRPKYERKHWAQTTKRRSARQAAAAAGPAERK